MASTSACLKAKGIKAMGQRSNLHPIAEDLGERELVDVLHANEAWDPTASTVVVAEGLLMYLSPDLVRALFEQCAAITGANSRIAFTYIGTRANGQPDAGPWTWLVLCILKVSGGPWLWSTSPKELGPFLNETGWTDDPYLAGATVKYGVEFCGCALK
ncbi:MAG: class I SAM-dependent methyltransferase [Synechococcus sp.]